jgi:hypothetical protein
MEHIKLCNSSLPPGWRAKIKILPSLASEERISVCLDREIETLVHDELSLTLSRPATQCELNRELKQYEQSLRADTLEEDPLPAYIAEHLGLTIIRKRMFGELARIRTQPVAPHACACDKYTHVQDEQHA